MPTVLDRFLRYVRYDTQSREGSSTYPSTEGQLVLLGALASELRELGAVSVPTRHALARAAFAHTATYDAAIVEWLDAGGAIGEAPSAVDAVVPTTLRALRDGEGDVLVFLAGAPEIRRTGRAIDTALPARWRQRVDVVPLHGRLAGADQPTAE